MATELCSECGNRREIGYPCPTCTQIKEAKRLEQDRRRFEDKRSQEQRRHERKQFEQQRQLEEDMAAEADRRQRDALAEQLERQREEHREHREALAAHEERRQEQEEERLEEYRRITANADRLRAEAKIARASEVLSAGLTAEAAALCKSALDTDPSYLPAYMTLARALALDGDLPQSEVYLRKGLLLLRDPTDADTWAYASSLLGEFHFGNRELILTVCDQLASLPLAAVRPWLTILELVTEKFAEPSLLNAYKRSLRAALAVGLATGDSKVCLLVEALEKAGMPDEAVDVCTTRLGRPQHVNQHELSLWLTAIRLELARDGVVSEKTRRGWLKQVPSQQREKVRSLFEEHVVGVPSGSATHMRADDAEHVRQVALRALRIRYQEWLPEIKASYQSDAERKGAGAYDQTLEPRWKIEKRARRIARWTFWLLIILGVSVPLIAWPAAVIAWFVLRFVMPSFLRKSAEAKAAEARDSTTREEYAKLLQNEERRYADLLGVDRESERIDNAEILSSGSQAEEKRRLVPDNFVLIVVLLCVGIGGYLSLNFTQSSPEPTRETTNQRPTTERPRPELSGGTPKALPRKGLEWLTELGVSVPAENYPPSDYVDRGICPGEGCSYKTWRVLTDTNLVADWRKPGASRVIALVSRGQSVQALTGLVVIHRPTVVRTLKQVEIGDTTVPSGELLYLLTYRGEGRYTAYWRGTILGTFPACFNWGRSSCSPENVAFLAEGNSTWWVQMRVESGPAGWTQRAENFGGRTSF